MKLPLNYIVLYSLVLVASLTQPIAGLKPVPRLDSDYEVRQNIVDIGQQLSAKEKASFSTNNTIYEELDELDYPIQISEPYKTLLKTSMHFAVASSPLSNYISAQNFMEVVGAASAALCKPANLVRALGALTVLLAGFLGSLFVLPYSLIEAVWKSPYKLESYLPRGYGKMEIGDINMAIDQILDGFGMEGIPCRERLVCQTGQTMRCSFPMYSKRASRFITRHLPSLKRWSNKFWVAFLVGLEEQNCANKYEPSVDSRPLNDVCPIFFFGSLSNCTGTVPPAHTAKAPPSFQSLVVPRAQ